MGRRFCIRPYSLWYQWREASLKSGPRKGRIQNRNEVKYYTFSYNKYSWLQCSCHTIVLTAAAEGRYRSASESVYATHAGALLLRLITRRNSPRHKLAPRELSFQTKLLQLKLVTSYKMAKTVFNKFMRSVGLKPSVLKYCVYVAI